MSERAVVCNACNSNNIQLLFLENPNTKEMNCNAMFYCNACKCKFRTITCSPYYQNERDNRWIF
jgi:hypothetical protein